MRASPSRSTGPMVQADALPADSVVVEQSRNHENILGTSAVLSQRTMSRRAKSWADFWDVNKSRQSRPLPGATWPRNLIFALQADGVPRDEGSSDRPSIARSRNSIRSSAHQGVVARRSTDRSNACRDGEVGVTVDLGMRAPADSSSKGVPVEVVWTARCASASTWGVPQGRTEPVLAWESIAVDSPSQAAGRVRHAALLRSDQSGGL